jgi:hypothetical protein
MTSELSCADERFAIPGDYLLQRFAIDFDSVAQTNGAANILQCEYFQKSDLPERGRPYGTETH